MNGTANYQINNSINCDSMVFPDIIKMHYIAHDIMVGMYIEIFKFNKFVCIYLINNIP